MVVVMTGTAELPRVPPSRSGRPSASWSSGWRPSACTWRSACRSAPSWSSWTEPSGRRTGGTRAGCLHPPDRALPPTPPLKPQQKELHPQPASPPAATTTPGLDPWGSPDEPAPLPAPSPGAGSPWGYVPPRRSSYPQDKTGWPHCGDHPCVPISPHHPGLLRLCTPGGCTAAAPPRAPWAPPYRAAASRQCLGFP